MSFISAPTFLILNPIHIWMRNILIKFIPQLSYFETNFYIDLMIPFSSSSFTFSIRPCLVYPETSWSRTTPKPKNKSHFIFWWLLTKTYNFLSKSDDSHSLLHPSAPTFVLLVITITLIYHDHLNNFTVHIRVIFHFYFYTILKGQGYVCGTVDKKFWKITYFNKFSSIYNYIMVIFENIL